MEEVVVLDVLEPTCVYTFICVEIKTNTETVAPASCVPKGGDDAGERGPFFFYRGELSQLLTYLVG